jgi:outer membrane receptor protein involved in Fe transport
MSKVGLFLASASLMAVCGAMPAIAQTAPNAPSSVAPEPGEILITAEKRSSTVQRTPISITAISGAELRARGVVDIRRVAIDTPGVAVRSAGPGQNELDFRGLTSSGGAAPTVGFYLDEAPISPPAGANNGKVVIDPNLYDLDRVEILRGPQGTLYGSGSMGGTMKLITAQPDLSGFHVSGDVRGSFTDGGSGNAGESMMVNIPIVEDKLALRIVETYEHNSGWLDRIVLSDFPLEADFDNPPGTAGSTRGDVTAAQIDHIRKDVNYADTYGGRANLLYQATDRLSITLSGLYQKIEQGGANTVDSPPGFDADHLGHYQPYDVAEPFSDTFRLASGVVKYDFGSFSATSATSYWSRRESQVQDLSEDFQILVALPFYIASPLNETDTSRQFSEEFRLASEGGGKFSWLVGAFYSKFHSTFYQTSVIPDYEPLFGTGNFYTSAEPQKVRQIAGFGNVSYAFNSLIKLTAGLRYFTYKAGISVEESGVAVGGSITEPFTPQSAHGLTPMANLSITPNRDLLVYLTAAKGFRPGSGNQPVPVSGEASCLPQLESFGKEEAPTTYDPDHVWSYEAGEKARLMGGKVTFNSSVYYEQWRNIQLQVPLQCGFFYTDNGQRANVYGLEVESRFKLTDALSVSANGSLTHARYDLNSPETLTAKGDRIPNVPKYMVSGQIDYRRPISEDLDFVANVSDRQIGGIEDVTAQRNKLPGYNLLDARIGVDHKTWTATLFANNLTNKHAQLSDTNSLGANLPQFNRIATNQPRTIGVDVSFRY